MANRYGFKELHEGRGTIRRWLYMSTLYRESNLSKYLDSKDFSSPFGAISVGPIQCTDGQPPLAPSARSIDPNRLVQ